MSKTAKILLVAFLLLGAVGVLLIVRQRMYASEAEKEMNNSSAWNAKPHWKHHTLPEEWPSQTKEYEGFVVSFNRDNATPNYSAWELLGSEASSTQESRYSKFYADDEIRNRPSTHDYTRSGYDRGHLCPSADQRFSADAMRDCFSMANITPQLHALNNGAWKTLEEKCRLWAQTDSAIWIVAGPIYTDADRHYIGYDTKVRVPSAFFKVIVSPFADEPHGIAFIYPNTAAYGNMTDYSMSIDEAEAITGIDFFNTIPEEIQTPLESRHQPKLWMKKRPAR